ncbi:ergothioneine biosynthesis glutamate--cysteine ligase EgtA [Luedemannella helvata]|uniref:Glutamate--cysteine ligase EgtA n=1 Tax=Luedemannella helvata TaxID=349315 RepID=A0ABP4WP66_9ACTN
MATVIRSTTPDVVTLSDVSDAEGHITRICFKTGPPSRVGVELEWTVHHPDAPATLLDVPTLRAALGAHAPATLGATGPAQPLPAGGLVTVEPGGQVEISSSPARTLGDLHEAVTADLGHLTGHLAAAGLTLGTAGIDPHRPPRRLVDTPRYAAMERFFDARGPDGRTMMCSTAGLQVCIDAGTPAQARARWAALHEIGPALVAAFATARCHAGRDTGWASARMAAWFAIDPARTAPVPVDGADPAAAWARYALAAPLLCVRRDGDDWHPPRGVTFADWIGGALPRPPTVDDLDYHLGTLFPPVRPRGYLEVRYLDAQPGAEWIAPTAVVAALLADDTTTDRARAAAQPAAGRWRDAALAGVADPAVRQAAGDLLDLARRRLDRTGLSTAAQHLVHDIVDRRLRPQEDTT